MIANWVSSQFRDYERNGSEKKAGDGASFRVAIRSRSEQP